MPGLHWLTATPIAHRGLHDAATGIIENTASAFDAAIAGGFGIETDLQLSADGEAMVHHDDALGRLTEGDAALATLSAAELKAVRFKSSSDRILTLSELCDQVSGRATLVLELKSRFDGDRRLVQRTADILENYAGPVAVMSFDPGVVEAMRAIAPGLPRGIVAERRYDDPEWAALPPAKKREMVYLLHAMRTRPHFIAYSVKNLPAVMPVLARALFGLPLLTWTVRSAADRKTAKRWADQIIFEGALP